MVNSFEICANIFEELIMTSFMTLYFGCRYRNWKNIFGFLLTVIISVAVSMIFTALNIYEGLFGLTYIIIYFLYALLFLKGDTYTKLFVSGFINCIVYFIALLSILSASVLLGTSSSQYFSQSADRFIGVIFSKIILIAACLTLLKFKVNNIMGRGNMIVLTMMPIAAMLSMIGIMQAFLNSNDLKHELLLASVSVMLTNILIYYVFIKINDAIKRETEIRALKQKYENDKKYMYDVEKLYSKICGVRHDMTKHLETVSALIGKDDSKASEYIKSVTRNHLDGFKKLMRTDNEYFDAVTNTKLAVCDKLGIKVQVQFQNGSLEGLRPDEIGIIFGNLFDNAIEASKNTPDKCIDLYVQMQDKRCSIMMTNSINSSVLRNNMNLTSTKKDKEEHGYGLKNIKSIVDRHKGIINFFEENGRFGCDILL